VHLHDSHTTEEPGDQVIRRRLQAAVRDPEFVRAVLTGPRLEGLWRRAVVRAVEIRGRRRIQVSTAGDARAETHNAGVEATGEELERLARLRFRNAVIHTRTATVTIRVGKRRTRVHTDAHAAWEHALHHDREPRRLLSPERDGRLLEALGMLTADGRVRESEYAKYRQVNELLRIVQDTVGRPAGPPQPMTVVDFGCGSAHLTFGLHHYLRSVLGHDVAMAGVDRNPELVARNAALAASLGWHRVRFVCDTIEAFAETGPADLVVSLHACDTATDEVLARAITWRARWILSVPCCHHHLQSQLRTASVPAAYRDLARHGILLQRMGDLLTDTFRSMLLEMSGYRAEVVEFVDPTHTARNLLIRAVRSDRPPRPEVRERYEALKAEWGVVPYLETLLAETLNATGRDG
jgi:SAM-dependent methyltransferase